VLLELLDLLRVGLLVQRPRRQAGVPQALQEVVGAVERVAHAELPLEDAHYVPAAQRADAVRRPRPGVEPRPQFRRARAR